jgi:hypothetical protein
MAMNDDAVKETFDELFTLLEALETQSAAILQCLRDQGITPDEKLGPYLEQAGKASNVKWRAARMRMEYLFSPTKKGVTGATEKKEPREDGDKGENEDKQAKHAESQTKEDRAAEKQRLPKRMPISSRTPPHPMRSLTRNLRSRGIHNPRINDLIFLGRGASPQ